MDNETLDLGGLTRTLLRYWWLIALGAIAGGLIAVYTFESSIPLYSSTVKLFVQGNSNSAGLSASDIDESRRISQLYGDLATTRPILDAVAENEDVPFTSEQLRGKISVRESRSFIEITVTDQDPVLVATVANATAGTLISELANRQIAQIAQFQDSLEQLGLEGDSVVVTTQAANLPILSIAEEAQPAVTPINNTTVRMQRVILGWMLGLLAAMGFVCIRYLLDDTIKSEDDFEDSTGLVILGAVPQYRRTAYEAPILMKGNGRHHPAAEAYYIIRANIDYALQSSDSIRTVLVTGPGPGEGKSSVASNLAVAFAREGNSVVLVDTDLRRPVQHLLFEIDDPDACGVVDVLNGSASVDQALRSTSVGGLKLITAGIPPENPDHLLRGSEFTILKNRLNEIADIVVYDSPPVLVVSDPLILAEGVDLAIMVSQAGSTKRTAARDGAEALSRPNIGAVVGVLTKQRTGVTGYGYNYGYSSYYEGNGQVHDGIMSRSSKAARRLASRTIFWRNGNHRGE